MEKKIIIAAAAFLLIDDVEENKTEVKTKRNIRRVWVKPWILRRGLQGYGENLLRELKFEDPFKFRRLLRMSSDTIEELVKLLTPIISKNDTVMRKSIPVYERLAVTLRYLATGETQSSLEAQFRIAQNTISGIISEVCEALYTILKDKHLKVPATEEEWRNIIESFNKLWQFPNCFGAIDGKHVAIKALKEDGSMYYNYKGFNSIILMAVVDAEYRFIYVDVGVNGRVSDGGVFNKCSFKGAIENNILKLPQPTELPYLNVTVPFVMVGDDAFSLSNYLMKPYSGRNLSKEEIIFNYRLSRARRVSENAFGILNSKFQIFSKAINAVSKEKIQNIVLASCALHNYLRNKNLENGNEYITPGSIDCEDLTSGTIKKGNWRDNNTLVNLQQSKTKAPTTAKQNRDILKEFFNTVGQIPWQNTMCNLH